MKKFLLAVASLCWAMTISAEPVTNETIVHMLEQGYSPNIIITQIENSDDLNLSADIESLDALMRAGADSSLILYIQNLAKKSNKLEGGIYWYNTGENPVHITIVPIEKKTGLGHKIKGSVKNITGSIFGKKGDNGIEWIPAEYLSSSDFKSDKLILSGESSDAIVKTRKPVFRFIKPNDEVSYSDSESGWYYTWLENIATPAEFQLIKLEPKGKEDKAYRQFPDKLEWTESGFSTKNAKSRKSLVGFKVNKVKDGIYEISFDQPLEPGDYVFFYKKPGSRSLKGLTGFDFTIDD